MKEAKDSGSAEEITVEFFRTEFGKEITIEEARQINERVNVVLTLLAKWDREQRSKSPATETQHSDHRSVG